MSDYQEQPEERPCLHCLVLDLIEEFFEQYPGAAGEPGTIDADEVLTAVAKTVAELTSSQDAASRRSMIDQLMQEIMRYDGEFRETEATGTARSDARH